MNILKVKDGDGNWVDIPALKGDTQGPTDDQVQDAVDDYLDDHPAVTGTFTNAAKRALISFLEHVAYKETNGQELLADLAFALNPTQEYQCTNTLTGCTTSNSAFVVYSGDSYSATITAAPGYTLTGAAVSVTMGGVTVENAYSNGTINIPEITGGLVIAIAAVSTVSSISAVFTQGQAEIFDNDTLDSLEQYLVVTATYSGSTTAVVTDYTLSGTLTEGTSTITVSYGGKTDTFTVTVSHSVLWVFTSGRALSKGISSNNKNKVWKNSTSGRAVGAAPIVNNGYTFTVTDSSLYQLVAYDITDDTAESTSQSGAIGGVWYQGGTKSISWKTSDSVSSAYVWLSLKKISGSFTEEELADGASAVFTYTTT